MDHLPDHQHEIPSEDGAADAAGLCLEELEAESADQLPDRHAMSVLDSNVTIPVNPAIAADVLSNTLDGAFSPDDPEAEG